MVNNLKKCLITYNYGKDQVEKIKDLGYHIIFKKEEGLTYDKELEEVEALICYNPFETLDIKEMKNLKWIQLSSVGIDQLPKDKVIEEDILVTNNRGGYSIPMGEWIVLNILELYKKRMDVFKNRMNKKWKMDTSILELYGKTVGFIGTGTIAQEGAKRLQGFGIKAIGMNTDGRDVQYFDKCYKKEEINKMLSISDVVVVTIPYTKDTHHLLNKERLQVIKDNAVIINVARGSIIDEKSLIEELNKGRFMGAALDVFETEPLPKDSELWDMNNVIITCHNSWMSEERNNRRFDTVYENLKRYSKGEDLLNIVDIERGY
ncbi:phosphoglycerate dehydrogenase [Clostridium sp. MSJ-4]|uniref:Phosphoglycerate dehydrogenase n=1 Tax=Clostridium simiarum TaxID=2841506 RepID=A0ABS6F1F3_9CLOT|nr:phosphoglycerate dehydrogenase [Clostridium simiarum]MBU5592337.1 phosphoglycerate dehydrogenase [Clostridium simiarum]